MVAKDLVTLLASHRSQRRWNDMTDRLELMTPTANKTDAFRSGLVDRTFQLAIPPEPPSGLIGRISGKSLQFAIGVFLGFGVAVMMNLNWLIIVTFCISFTVLALFLHRIKLLVLASSPIQHLRPTKTNTVPNPAFLRFHIRALQLLGFESIDGSFKSHSKHRTAFATSADELTWAEISFVRDKDKWIASRYLKSLMNDGELVTTEIQCSNEQGTEVGVEFLSDTFRKHNEEVERYCLTNQKKVTLVTAETIRDVYRHLAITEKLKLQELVRDSAASVLVDWKWFPNWLRVPVARLSQ